jgi:hypothetical protein
MNLFYTLAVPFTVFFGIPKLMALWKIPDEPNIMPPEDEEAPPDATPKEDLP